MTEEEKKAKIAKLEKDLGTVKKLSAGLADDIKKETEPLKKEDLEAQEILVNRQIVAIEAEIGELKNAKKDGQKRGLRSVFGRR